MLVGQRVGPFDIDKEIGSGAMGTVYRARFDKNGTIIPVALKVIALGLLGNEGAMARFSREAAILKQLRHKHIVRLIAIGRYKQTPFIAMEYVDGEALDRILTRRGRLGWEEVVGYCKQLCEALQYAHEKGIIHRDLKPSNLMITQDGTLKLTDFGIAKDTDVTALTAHNSTIGTAAYMSPEQCKGDRHLTNKSDLYSLGVVFYELLTGKKPFVADTTVDMFLKHVNEKPVRPSRLVPDLPVWLDNMVMFLLEKEKDRRPLDAATVGAMLADIEEKVRTQHSAGADAANARRIDRPFGEQEFDETDREAAKTLRDGAKGKPAKKPKKKKSRPLVERGWVRAIPLVAFLALIVGFLYYALKPPTREDLFNAWKNAPTPAAKVAAAERYLNRFADVSAEETEQVRGSIREANGERLQAVLLKRFKNRNQALKITSAQEGEDPEAFAQAWAGLEQEEKGELGQALASWKALAARGPDITDTYKDGWLWLAQQHVKDLGSLDARLTEVRRELSDGQNKELPWKFDPTEPDALARMAVRLDPGKRPVGADGAFFDPNRKLLPQVHDPVKARKTWVALADLTRDKAEQRVWYLLAVRERDKREDRKGEAVADERVTMLGQLLATAGEEWKRVGGGMDLGAEQRDCRNRCRDVIELYGDETDERVKKLVKDAEARLDTMKPPG